MSNTNPELEKDLDALAEICCQSLEGNEGVLSDRSEAILKSLLMSGYVRKYGKSLQANVESRVKHLCREPAIHRGGEISGMTRQLQKKFDELVLWESNSPDDESPPKSANISSATDA